MINCVYITRKGRIEQEQSDRSFTLPAHSMLIGLQSDEPLNLNALSPAERVHVEIGNYFHIEVSDFPAFERVIYVDTEAQQSSSEPLEQRR